MSAASKLKERILASASQAQPKPVSDTYTLTGFYDRVHRVFRSPDGALLLNLHDLLPEEARGEEVGHFAITVAFKRKP